MPLLLLYEAIDKVDLTASQQRALLRMAGIPRDKWPQEDVCLIKDDGGIFRLAMESGDLGPSYVWDGNDWSPL